MTCCGLLRRAWMIVEAILPSMLQLKNGALAGVGCNVWDDNKGGQGRVKMVEYVAE